jgi:hypothetical protein
VTISGSLIYNGPANTTYHYPGNNTPGSWQWVTVPATAVTFTGLSGLTSPAKEEDELEMTVYIRAQDLDRVRERKLTEVKLEKTEEFTFGLKGIRLTSLLDDGHGHYFVHGA